MPLLARFAIGLLAAGCVSGAVRAAEPLHVEIDRLIEAKFEGRTPAEPADDAAFLRRVWLDLAGRIPSAVESRAFLDDTSPDKREKLIDRLLAEPTYVDRMENLFHVMLMERRGDDAEWRKFLRTSLERNVPWDEFTRAILDPDAEDENARGAAFFYTKRLESYGQNPTDFAGLTRDVGRLFLGIDLQCAECHDHLFIDDYRQVEFQGLFAVYRNLAIRKEEFPAVQQKTPAPIEFVSVFDPTQKQTGPRIPFGEELDVPEPPPEESKPKKGEPAEPPFDTLALVAAELPTAEHELFTKNAVNRLWFAMTGRGLVMPLDLFHSGNPPSHPELLDLLAREFAAHDFDVKWLLREIALSRTYQRSSVVPDAYDTPPPPESFLVGLEKRLSAEQLLAGTVEATGNAERLTKPDEKGEPTEQYVDLQKQFRAAFANEEREPEVDLNASVKGALFLLNDDDVLALLKPEPGNLADRLSKIDDAGQLTDELFLSVLTRLPTEEERAAVVAHIEQNADRRDAAIGHAIWSLLASAEFCVNH